MINILMIEDDASFGSMGLGLYIVKSILDIHNLRFDYEYIDGNNIFIISRI